MRPSLHHRLLLGLLAVLLCQGAVAAHAQPWLATGTYNGNGNDGRVVEVAPGFQPDVVFITSGGNEGTYCRTSTMPAGQSRSLGRNHTLESNRIVSLDADGFTVDGTIEVNDAAETYHWVAMRADPEMMQVGSYNGFGFPDMFVGPTPSMPVAVIVMNEANELPVFRTDPMAAYECYPLRGENPLNNAITYHWNNGFTVGSDATVNSAGGRYHYIAWFDAPGSVARGFYLGDKAEPRAIPSPDLNPMWVMVRGEDNRDGVHRGSSLDGDLTHFFQDRDPGDRRIMALGLNEFEVGDRAETNDSDVTYYWLALTDPDLVDVGIELAVDDPAPDVDETVTFSATVANFGGSEVWGIEVTGLLPTGLIFESFTASQGGYDDGTGVWDVDYLNVGETATLDVVVRVEPAAAGQTLPFSIQVTGATPADDNAVNDRAEVEVSVPLVDVGLTIAVTDTLAAEGDVIVFGISASNTGPDLATGLEIEVQQDPRLVIQLASPSQGSYDGPSGVWNVGDLTPGTAANLILATRIAAGAGGDTLQTMAVLRALHQADLSAADDTATIAVQVVGTTPSADLGLAIVSSDPAPAVGDVVVQTVTLRNAGPDGTTDAVVAVDWPAELDLTSATPSFGSWDGAGTWNVDSLAAGSLATLVLVAEVLPAAAGRTLTTTTTVTAFQPDPNGANDTAAATIDVSPLTETPYLEIVPVPGDRVTVVPSVAPRPVLVFHIVNHGSVADTVRQLTVSNLTVAPGSPAQTYLDGEWEPLAIFAFNRVDPVATGDMAQPRVSFADGRAEFVDLAWALAPGDSFFVSISTAPSLVVRDGADLVAGLSAPADCLANQPVVLAGGGPLVSGHGFLVDGFSARQVTLHEVPHSLLAVGSRRNLVLDVTLPRNGYLTDYLFGLNLENHGSALAGVDIEPMEAWGDDGDGVFEPANDTLLGELVDSGAHWQLTGLHTWVPPNGLRVFVSVDIAETAQPARDIRMGLPYLHGPGVEMDSGNDGPLDAPVENKSSQGISATDRVIVTADWVPPGTVHPGDRNVRLLNAVLTNTYGVDQVFESLTVTNATVGTVPATTGELDGVLQQVVLRLDGDGDGALGDLATDPALGSGAFADGTVTFPGLDLTLPAGAALRIYVTGDVSLTAAAEGDSPGLLVADATDLVIPGANTVATWPLTADADRTVDGMVADQIVTGAVPTLSLAPFDSLALAFDVVVPPNGYKDDELVGLTLVNRGTATVDDLSRVRLWQDGGDGVFDAWSGDDLFLGDMTRIQDSWSSPVLGHPVGAAGVRVFASVDVAAAATDSATVRLALPRGGLILDSQNSGPLDREIVADGTLVLSTSPLRSTVVFDTEASTVGQTGTIRMSVSNIGTESLSGVVPELLAVAGTAGLSVGAAQPTTLDLAADESAEFTWSFTATAPGDVAVTANAEGAGAAQNYRSAPTPSPNHAVYDPALWLDCYPMTSLPGSVNKGQSGLIPVTLTLANPGAETVADVALTGLRLRFSEHAGGPGIVPDDLVDAITVFEGTNVYAFLDVLPVGGAEVDLVFAEPAIVTHREPITLGVRMDLNLNTTASSFVVSLEDASFVSAVDGVSGATVPVILAGDNFPLRTGEAQLTAPAGVLAVAMTSGAPHAASPGQADLPLAAIEVTNVAGDASSSAINLSSLAFVLRDTMGAALTLPHDVIGEVAVHSAYQQHFGGFCTVLADSVLLVEFTTPAVVPADATVVLDLRTALQPDATAQAVVPALADPDLIDGVDANNGEPVPVDVSATVPGPRLDILDPPDGATADGRGLLPPDVAVGAQDLQLLEVVLGHPGTATMAAIDVDSLTVLVRDGAGLAVDPAVVFDRVWIAAGSVVHGDVVDPAAPDGRLTVPTPGLALIPGASATLTCTADLAAGFDTGTFQLILALDGIALSDAVSGEPVIAVAAAPVWPLGSGIARVLVPAEELAVGGANLMPPLLTPGPNAYPALELSVQNTAAPGGGSIELQGLVVDQPAPGIGDLNLGEAAAALQVLLDGQIIGQASGLTAGAADVTVDFASALQIAAGATVDLQIALVVALDAPAGSVCLRVSEDGPQAGHPGSSVGGIRIVPASGQALPLVSLEGNIGKAGLADSYVNFPNPFAAGHESTVFAYALPQAGAVTLRVLTPHGEPVATVLDREPRPAGFHQGDSWTGVNGRGVAVRNGVYIAEIVVDYDDGSRERHLRKVAVVR